MPQSNAFKFANNILTNGGYDAADLVGAAGGENTPAFEAYLTSQQTISNDVATKLTLSTELFDTNNNYDASTNYRFTPTTSGKYFVYGSVTALTSDGNFYRHRTQIYKNGASYRQQEVRDKQSSNSNLTIVANQINAIIDMNGTTDYLELYTTFQTYTGGSVTIDEVVKGTYFGAYKLIGV